MFKESHQSQSKIFYVCLVVIAMPVNVIRDLASKYNCGNRPSPFRVGSTSNLYLAYLWPTRYNGTYFFVFSFTIQVCVINSSPRIITFSITVILNTHLHFNENLVRHRRKPHKLYVYNIIITWTYLILV